MKNNKLKIVVAMSGGVDSSVAAALLKKSGVEVIGIFMKFWKAPAANKGQSGWNRCCTFESEQRARAVARVLNIPFYVLNLEKQFQKKVVEHFLQESRAGRTPNPCVVCNKEIKFGLLLEKAMAMAADYVATGHYARLRREILNPKSEILNPEGVPRYRSGPYGASKSKIPACAKASAGKQNSKFKTEIQKIKLLRARDKDKDQSYFLWQLSQKQLAKILLPIGEIISKAEVRELAQKFNLPVAETKESQEICFVKDRVADFFKQTIGQKKGKIITKQGEVIGEHQGLWFYTIGQRKGITLPAIVPTSGKTRVMLPWYVVGKDIKKNNLIVSQNEKDLLRKELIAKNVNWISGAEPKLPLKVKAKIRYRSEIAEAVIQEKIGPKKYKVVFAKPQRAITPGQSVVFYSGEEMFGGGIIA